MCITFSFAFIAEDSLLTYDTFDKLFWALAIYTILCLIQTDNKKHWICFGIYAGLGLMNKFDMLWLGAGVLIALMLTPQRKYFLCWQLWASGLIALLILSPYLAWIIHTHFLTWEFFSNYHLQTVPINFLGFFRDSDCGV